MTSADLLIAMSLKAWNQQSDRAGKIWNSMTDEQLLRPVAADRNRIIYLLGHLTASNDGLFPLFSDKPRMFPEWEEIFLKTPDAADKRLPETSVLREAWTAGASALSGLFAGFSTADWLDRHNAMTADDLAADPGRNKMSVLFSRTAHMAYHIGQILLVK